MTREKDSKLGFAVIAAMGVFIFGCTKERPAASVAADIPVLVAKASQQAMPVEITSVGNVEAISTVSVRSQVAGPLLEVHFKEGDFVHKGQLLLTIDPRPYQAQVDAAKGAIVRDQADEKQAEASLAKDSAQEAYARGEAQRYANLLEKGLIPKETAEQMKSQASVASEALSADRAAIDKARASHRARSGHIECRKSAAQLLQHLFSDRRQDGSRYAKGRQSAESFGCADRRHQSGRARLM